MNISIIGQGYVGLSLAIGAASSGHKVVGFDTNADLVANLLEGKSHIPGLNSKTIVRLIKKGNYRPTALSEDMRDSKIVVIAVPTPLKSSREPDLDFLRDASIQIARTFQEPILIINESTSYPGTLRNFIKPQIETISKVDFIYAAAPERIDPGNETWNLFNTPRVICGLTEDASLKAFTFYKTICSKVIVVGSPEIAEASKLFENTFRQINIALANEFSIISRALGFSGNEAIQAASTKPFGFMPFYPSIGVGGHCIPIDPSYLSYSATGAGIEAKIINLANSINLLAAHSVTDKIEKFLGFSLVDMRIQIVGISYKSDVPDLRESPALNFINELRKRGAQVIWYDPIVKEYENEKSQNLDPTIDLGLIVTPHTNTDYGVWRQNNVRVLDLSADSNNYGWPKFL